MELPSDSLPKAQVMESPTTSMTGFVFLGAGRNSPSVSSSSIPSLPRAFSLSFTTRRLCCPFSPSKRVYQASSSLHSVRQFSSPPSATTPKKG